MDGVFQAGFDIPSDDVTMEARNLHVYISNNSSAASDLQVNWIGLSPGYFPGGFYTSCALDAGAGNDWSTASWSATLPAQTGVALEARTSKDGSTWNNWQVVSNGGDINPLGRYAQYRLNLASTDTLTTPLVNSVTLNYETFPTLAINDVTVVEGNAGTVNAVFTVTLSSSFTKTVVVNYSTANSTALAPGDYLTATGTLTFTSGITSQTITVPVVGDNIDENNETFLVNLSNPLNANISDGQGQGTITNDDVPPSLTINDISVPEGTGGTSNAVFTVSLSLQSGKTVTVNYATANGTATSPGDYLTSTGAVTFTPGITSQNITITVQADTTDENDETLLVNLNNAANANIADVQGVGTLLDDDDPPTVNINDVAVTEGSSGTINAVFKVSLSQASDKVINVDYATTNATATAPSDYLAATGTLTFTPGITSQQITVVVNGDGLVETDETFQVNLSNLVNVNPGDTLGLGTINNDDVPGVMITQSGGSTNVTEGGATDTYQVKLTSQPAATVTISISPTNQQVGAAPTTLTFNGSTWNTPQTVTVTAINDSIAEGAHTGVISHTATSADSNYNGLPIGNIIANITDNDTAGASVLPTTVAVKEGGITATYTIRLTSQPTATVTISMTTNGQVNVVPTSLNFNALNWNTPQTVTVTAVDDAVIESSPHSGTITHTISSTDPRYNHISISGINANITDNDTKNTFLPIVLK
jgi:hypothetical protein